MATNSASAPYRWSKHIISFSRADQWINFDHPSKYPLLVDPMIRESQVKKVLVDGGSSINVTFPRTLQALGVSIADLTLSDTPFDLRHHADRGRVPAGTHLHVCHFRCPRIKPSSYGSRRHVSTVDTTSSSGDRDWENSWPSHIIRT